MARSLWRQTVESLSQLSATETSDRLPPIRELCRRLSVSPVTLLKAVRFLERTGVLKSIQGKGIFIAGRKPPQSLPAAGRMTMVVEAVEKKIGNGSFRAGAPLPKVSWFTMEYRCSRNTICAALRELQRHGLIVKQGSRWIAGRPVPHQTSPVVTRPLSPVVLVVSYRNPLWETNPTANRFMQGFEAEADRYGIQLNTAFCTGDRFLHRLYPVGIDAIRRTVSRYGDRFLGVLFFLGYYPRVERSELADRIKRLGSFGRPVVTYDFYGSNCAPNSMLPAGKPYFYLSFDTARASALGAHVLAASGHRRVAIFRGEKNSPYQPVINRRIAPFIAAASSAKNGIAVIEISEQNRIRFAHVSTTGFYSSFISGIERRYREFSSRGAPAASIPNGKRVARFLSDMMPGFARLVTDGSISALAAPYDTLAQQYWACLHFLGLRVPRDISLLSLDNRYSAKSNPVSAVDHGVEPLGCTALHAFLDDIPIRRDARGNVRATPVFLDRGSIRQYGRREKTVRHL